MQGPLAWKPRKTPPSPTACGHADTEGEQAGIDLDDLGNIKTDFAHDGVAPWNVHRLGGDWESLRPGPRVRPKEPEYPSRIPFIG